MNNVLTFLGTDAELRPRKPALHDKTASEEDAKSKLKVKFAVVDPIGILKEGMRTVRHHTFGWLRDDLTASGKLDGAKESIFPLAMS